MTKDEGPCRLPGLYVHVPFCKTKCPYCDFYSVVEPGFVKAWLKGVDREAAQHTGLFHVFDTVYLGGGTPSLLDPAVVAALLESLQGRFQFFPGAEITLEANPDDITREKLSAWRRMGINRISLGVQSLNDDELRFLGRRHDAAGALKAMDLARQCGFENLGVDLIYGFDAGTGSRKGVRSRWKHTLGRVLDFGPEHLSCYQMTVEEGTVFGRMKSEGRLASLGEARESALFLFTSEFLEAHGYTHYEISNFARGLENLSRHNTKYWHHVPYLGLGPAAHSFRDERRWWNVRSVEDYCRLLSSGGRAVCEWERLTREQMELEALFLGIRTREGIEESRLSGGADLKPILSELCGSGILKASGGRLIPTVRGFLVADSLPLLLSR